MAGGKVANYISKRWGCLCTNDEVAVVLNAANAVPVLPADPNRFSYTIFNLGAAVGHVGPTTAVGPLFGIQLNAAGDFMSVNADDDGAFPTHELFGLGVAATTLYIVSTRAVK